MLTTARRIVPEHQDLRPDLLKAFNADFQRIFFDKVTKQPDSLKSRSTVELRSGASRAEVGPQGNTTIVPPRVTSKVTHRVRQKKNESDSPRRLERYMLDEAEYIRTFGY